MVRILGIALRVLSLDRHPVSRDTTYKKAGLHYGLHYETVAWETDATMVSFPISD